MKQQTAVEWLFQKMTEQGTNPYWDMRFIQAKQMEKEQIMKAWKDRVSKLPEPKGHVIDFTPAEEYYNDNYNK